MNKVVCVIGATVGAVVGVPLLCVSAAAIILGMCFCIGWVELWLLPLERFNSAPVFWGYITVAVPFVSCLVYAVGCGLYDKCEQYWEGQR